MLLIVGAAHSMAEGTTGVEPAGRAEKAAAARPEALGLGRMAKQGVRLSEAARWCRPMMFGQPTCLWLKDLECGERRVVVREKENPIVT